MSNLGFHPEMVDMFTKKGFEMVKKERAEKIKAPEKFGLGVRLTGKQKSDKWVDNLYFSPSSDSIHKGTDPVKPYGYKRDILFGETTIMKDINNVKKC